jgi:hypothetical protein
MPEKAMSTQDLRERVISIHEAIDAAARASDAAAEAAKTLYFDLNKSTAVDLPRFGYEVMRHVGDLALDLGAEIPDEEPGSVFDLGDSSEACLNLLDLIDLAASPATNGGSVMPTAIPETLTIESSLMIELLAAIHALGDAQATISHDPDSPTQEWATRLRTRTQDSVFGVSDPDLYESETFPAEVAITARAMELEADLLEGHVERKANEEPFTRRADKLRQHGQDMRTAGTVGVNFPTGY